MWGFGDLGVEFTGQKAWGQMSKYRAKHAGVRQYYLA